MTPTNAVGTVRMRVRECVGIQSNGAFPSDTANRARVVCAVGEIETGKGSETVVWIRGGLSHDAAQINHDTSSDTEWIHINHFSQYTKPITMSDEVALLADDVAAMIHAAKIVKSRKLCELAVFTTSKTTSSAYFFLKILDKIYEPTLQLRPLVSIVFMDSVPANTAAITSSQTTTRTFSHEDIRLKDTLKLDGCLDLCCSDKSFELATRHVEPLGTLILRTPPPQDSGTVAIDMNAVVVNELVLLYVGDYLGELPRALEFLAEQDELTV